MNANIGISESNSKAVALELNKLLANEFILYTKTRSSHWNIEGSNFMELHKLFEGQYEELAEIVDSVAERVRSIGHYSEGRLEDFLKLTDLLEQGYSDNQKTLITNLVNDHETIIRQLRRLIDEFANKYNDAGSSDFVTGLIGKHEKTAWMLRSYLK
jgi:starvation-inducible DNA-binding protein